jgi:2,4-didehydro-3-deoxy-L-rhamnonate hydrolase
MKLLRYGPAGQEKPGILDSAGKIRDLSAVITDLDAEAISDQGLARLSALDRNTLPLVGGTPRIGVPLSRVGKFLCIGLNYSDHAAESGMPVPKEPILFMKANSSISGPNDNVMLPKDSRKSDWEVELGVIIGRTAQHVSEENALQYVAGYCVVNDVSEREFQLERGGQWVKGKSCDTFGPIGPYMVTRDEVEDPQKLGLWLELNGKRVQNGTTSTMVFGVKHLISYLSRFMTLSPGDVISTGTPPGVGLGMKPPLFLKAGDVMRLGVDGLGEQRQQVIAWAAAR